MPILRRIANDSTLKARRRPTALGRKARSRCREVAFGATAFFSTDGRTFPWRDEREPYRLAIAEILLQKTRAQSVVSTYESLLSAYPTPEALAMCDVNDIEIRLRPLGLSGKRADQLKGMATAVVMHGVHIFGSWRAVLVDVPGIGAYAARAIASFGRAERVGIVDANVARILRRIFKIRTVDPRAVIFQKYADQIALYSDDVRATNFGLLDIGSLVCLPKPLCGRCPYNEFCPRYGIAAHPGKPER